jgi:soluble lytic murein transglycosylase-like protein
MWYDKVEEPIIEDPLIEDTLIEAIMQVESGGDTLAYNSKEDAVGCLQIRPIMVREVNRLLGKDSFTLSDRWSKVKSIQMFNILRSHLKGASDEQIARVWNGGYNGKNNPKTLQYWKKVKQYTQKNIK